MKKLKSLQLILVLLCLVTTNGATITKMVTVNAAENQDERIAQTTIRHSSVEAQDLPQQSSITKDSITWTFSEAVPVGQFVNGDYYVVGPVTVTNIDPLPTTQNGRHGSTINMPCTENDKSPFDSRVVEGRYAPELRIYPPFTMQPGNTLISSISVDTVGQNRNWLRESDDSDSPVKSISVLTVLDAPVAADAFRPSYCDRTQKIYYANNLRRWLLPTLPKVPSTLDITVFAEHFRQPWLDVCFFDFDSAIGYQTAYGRETGRAVGMAALLLMLDFTPQEKEPLLINFVQHGIDLWGIAGAGYPGWPAHGGHGSGRKWPIIFSGILLGESDMQTPNKTYPNLKFGEDMQTMHANGWTGATAVYAGHQGVWNGEAVSSKPSWGPYEHLHPSEWHSLEPGPDTFYYIGESYRRCCTSLSWVGQALGAHLMDAKTLWDHSAFFDYVDRWMTEDDTQHVAIIETATGQDYSASWERQGQAWDEFVEEMWATYHDLQPSRLNLSAAPRNQAVHLIWNTNTSLPESATWTITYDGPQGEPQSPITGIPSSVRSYTISELTNHRLYTFSVNTVEVTPPLSDTVQTTPTDIFIYLPMTQR